MALQSPDTIPAKSKALYVAIVALLLAAFVAFFVYRGITASVDSQPETIQQNNSATNSGSTDTTGAPTADTGTQDDRTNPDPSGGNSNTILNPEQSDEQLQ